MHIVIFRVGKLLFLPTNLKDVKEFTMKSLYYFLIFISTAITLKGSSFEIIPNQFKNVLTESITCPFIVNDTLYSYDFNNYLIKSYKNKKWCTEIYYDSIISKINNQAIIEKINTLSKYLFGIKKDKSGNLWLYTRDYILKYNGLITKCYDSFYIPDSSLTSSISFIYSLDLNNYEVPYIIIKSPNDSYQDFICKLENDTFKVKNLHSSQVNIPKQVYFDSKNNFWETAGSVLNYYEDDKIIKTFSMSEMPKTEQLQGGYFTKICIDSKDKVYAVSNLLGIYIYENEKWSIDDYISSRQYAIRPDFEEDKSFDRMAIDSKDNLWINGTMFSSSLCKLNKDGIWSEILLPNLPNYIFVEYEIYVHYDEMLIDYKDRIWLFYASPYRCIVYTPQSVN